MMYGINIDDVQKIIGGILEYLDDTKKNGNQIVNEFGIKKWNEILSIIRQLIELLQKKDEEAGKSLLDELGELENEDK